MKANHSSLWKNDDRAQVGIGTMIVFIATILVAATAAAVLIDTSGKLQERSSQTGDQATKQVASNLIVKSITGMRSGTSANIDWLNITVALAPGAKSVDAEQLKLTISNGDSIKTFNWASVEADDTFQVEFERDADTSENTLTAGDLVDLKIDLKRVSFSLAERKDATVTLHPEVGSTVDASFTTPESYGNDLLIFLR